MAAPAPFEEGRLDAVRHAAFVLGGGLWGKAVDDQAQDVVPVEAVHAHGAFRGPHPRVPLLLQHPKLVLRAAVVFSKACMFTWMLVLMVSVHRYFLTTAYFLGVSLELALVMRALGKVDKSYRGGGLLRQREAVQMSAEVMRMFVGEAVHRAGALAQEDARHAALQGGEDADTGPLPSVEIQAEHFVKILPQLLLDFS